MTKPLDPPRRGTPANPLARVTQGPGCWTVSGWHDRWGYTKLWRTAAHRFVYELLVGPIADGMELDHLCGNPGCVNPEHLEPVTRAENVRRAAARRQGQRPRRDAGHARSKLTWAIVEEIRSSSAPSRALARRYGVDPATIRAVRRGRAWVREAA